MKMLSKSKTAQIKNELQGDKRIQSNEKKLFSTRKGKWYHSFKSRSASNTLSPYIIREKSEHNRFQPNSKNEAKIQGQQKAKKYLNWLQDKKMNLNLVTKVNNMASA